MGAARDREARFWRSVRRRLRPGTLLNGGRYVIAEASGRRLVIQRTRSGSEEVVTRRRVLWAWRELRRGRPLARQASRPQGGMSYTVAVVAGVRAALGRRVRFDRDHDAFIAS